MSVGTGHNTNAIVSSGRSPSVLACSERYDGTGWSTAEPILFCTDRASGTGTVDTLNLIVSTGVHTANEDRSASYCHVNAINAGLYCFTKNLAPGNTDSSGTSYSSGY